MLWINAGEVEGWLVPLVLFVAAFFAIRYFARPTVQGSTRPSLSQKTARTLYWILGAVVLIWLLSAIGLFGEGAATNVRPFG